MKGNFNGFRREQGPNGDIVPFYTDRSVPDQTVRARIRAGGK